MAVFWVGPWRVCYRGRFQKASGVSLSCEEASSEWLYSYDNWWHTPCSWASPICKDGRICKASCATCSFLNHKTSKSVKWFEDFEVACILLVCILEVFWPVSLSTTCDSMKERLFNGVLHSLRGHAVDKRWGSAHDSQAMTSAVGRFQALIGWWQLGSLSWDHGPSELAGFKHISFKHASL